MGPRAWLSGACIVGNTRWVRFRECRLRLLFCTAQSCLSPYATHQTTMGCIVQAWVGLLQPTKQPLCSSVVAMCFRPARLLHGIQLHIEGGRERGLGHFANLLGQPRPTRHWTIAWAIKNSCGYMGRFGPHLGHGPSGPRPKSAPGSRN
jgi:hypothetical protein